MDMDWLYDSVRIEGMEAVGKGQELCFQTCDVTRTNLLDSSMIITLHVHSTVRTWRSDL